MTDPQYTPYMRQQIARADNWFPMIAGASPDIVSIDRLWETIRDTEHHVSRDAFRIAARAHREQDKILDAVNRLPDHHSPSRRWFIDAHQKMQKNYLYVLQWTGRHLETGLEVEASTAIWSDQPLTIGEIFGEAESMLLVGSPPLEIVDVSYVIAELYHKHGADW